MLVVWGDRERLADDIETWIDSVRQSQSGPRARRAADSFSDDKPGQDVDPSQRSTGSASSRMHGPSLQERRAASRSPHRSTPDSSEQAVDWLCTAVEHGPGGVHAWPFVSMYLAGSEAEREKGLEILARFIAEPTSSPPSTVPPTPTSPAVPLAVQLPGTHQQRFLSAAANSPPHLNAVSPAGSMPSDISSRGDADDNDYPFLGSSYTGSEGWDPSERNELGLEGVYPHETVWTQPTPTPSTGMGTPLDSDMERESIGHDELVRRIGLGLGGSDAIGIRESGGTTMEPVRLLHPGHSAVPNWSQQQNRPQQRPASTASQPRASATPVHYSSAQSYGVPVGGRSLADLEAESDMSAPASRPDSPGVDWKENERGYDAVNEDDLDAPSPELDREAYFEEAVSYADDAIPMDPGFYGLAHYHTLRPEGLSDIAEEESQLDTSSVLSSGYGALSPGSSDITFSPHDGRSPSMAATRAPPTNPGRYASAYTPSAAEMARLREALGERERQYQQRFARGSSRFPIEEDDDDDDDDAADAPIGDGYGSDGDVDWLDMDDQQQHQQQQQEQAVSPWRSSAELPNLSALQEQQDAPTSRDSPRARPSGETPSASSTKLSTKVDDDGSGQSQTQAGESDVQLPPSPARSTSSQTSGSRDVWW
ncbi:hypothetical protein EX895_002601 [Sporisorium graminicola]|uniref:Uncharacterized protein n=1 Tax=Sporisorium graminicola TaxID=280036 RepID=A0A4U7L0B7_9BASI|nr:hypothetical protein EX895_002601 [Sporisorium graminicola]TKY88612.1 hypothetical protein EX895_002601 [Sporisorium graminicola]